MVSPSDLRVVFEARLNKDEPPVKFHPADLERIKDDRYLLRVLEHCKNDLQLASKLLWHIMKWRNTVGASDINESNVRMDYADEGLIFPHGRDLDGCRLVILKCKSYVKGKREFEEVKKGIIYWLDRIEREEDGNKVTLFFDLDGCGLQNMDVELIKYLINILTYYYPLFLNQIIVFQLPWVMTAAFKLVKSFLRPEAVELLKFANKSTLKELVHPDQALVCWGGNNDYVFKFVPEKPAKKVTFAPDGEDTLEKPNSTISNNNDGTYFTNNTNDYIGEILHLEPRERVIFKYENEELLAKIKITNLLENMVAFKIKTTAPDKFWVRPTSAFINPRRQQTVLISLLPGYQTTAVKDKFMIMAVEVGKVLNKRELEDIWKKSDKIDEYRLRCQLQDSVGIKNNSNGVVAVNNIKTANLEEKLDATKIALQDIRKDIRNIRNEIGNIKQFHMVSLFLTCCVLILALGFIRNLDNLKKGM